MHVTLHLICVPKAKADTRARTRYVAYKKESIGKETTFVCVLEEVALTSLNHIVMPEDITYFNSNDTQPCDIPSTPPASTTSDGDNFVNTSLFFLFISSAVSRIAIQ